MAIITESKGKYILNTGKMNTRHWYSAVFNLDRNLDTYTNLVHVKLVSTFYNNAVYVHWYFAEF